MSLLQAGFGSSGEYTIDDSLRFRNSAGAYLSRTNAANGNLKTFTFSGWIKYSYLGGGDIWSSGNTSGGGDAISFRNSDNKLNFALSGVNILATNAVYRDPSAWYHIVLAFDTSQATASNRIKLYVNGEQITSFLTASYPSLNTDAVYFNTTTIQYLAEGYSSSLDCYLTEVNFIDGQQLTADDFGEFDDNGTWKPLAYTGTYGTNGFYLNGVGVTDESGNGNDWTNNNLNLSTSTDTTYDQMKDTPSLVDTNAGNFAVWNPLDKRASGATTYADGNLSATVGSSGSTEEAFSTFAFPTTGKWYCEVTVSNIASGNARIGIANLALSVDTRNANGYLYQQDGQKYVLGTASAYGSSWTTNDIIGLAFDADAGSITFYKNNTSQGAITSISITAQWIFGATGKATVLAINFGQRPFAYTPPSGFLKLNTFNLPDSTIEKGSDYFNTVLYTGNGSTQSITGVGFQPDLVVGKGRTYAGSGFVWYDSVRGATKWIGSYSTAAETTVTGVTSFDADGFSVGSSAVQNLNASPYVAWNWLASNTTASNTVGSITSTVSVNTTSGFSIVSYTGTGSAATVGHGLGVAPSMMIIKTRSAVNSWVVYHQSLGNTKAIYLNLTGAADTNASFWNNTSPTSSVLTVNTDTICNQNGTTYVGYCFAEVPGYSAFGSYTGNGSTDGTFVYTGFRPAWVMIKSSSSAGDSWFVLDSKRTTTNVMGDYFRAESTNAEATTTALDLLSNGFKLRTTSGAFNDATTFIYMAFAENPFKNANAR
jgi:hypothetical protein